MKIVIMGYSGAGKSTLARWFADYYGIPCLYLDCVNFKENWQMRDREEGRQMVADFMKQDSWVIDGNYSEFHQAERIDNADLVVILQYSRIACIKGVFGRYFTYRCKTRESIADGCAEKIDPEFFWWVIHKQYSKEKKDKFRSIKSKYPEKTHIIKSRRELNAFLENVIITSRR